MDAPPPAASGTADRVDDASPDVYRETLQRYIATRDEDALYRASLQSQRYIERGMGPDEIIAIHFEALDGILTDVPYREQSRIVADAHQFLLEVMIAYGVRYREYLELRLNDERREAELREAKERARALEAERDQRDRAELLAIVAHELRTPLTAALGNVELALRLIAREEGMPARFPILLDSTRDALRRLARLTEDLVEASRGEATVLERTEQDLRAVVRLACAWAAASAEEKGISLRLEDDGPRPRVLGDADALASVCGNLLSNAVRYTPPGGRVTVRVGLAAPWAWVEVEDTGIGMSAETQARIFEKFYRAPAVRDIEVSGLGLGLALVNRLVEGHGGRVEVRSAPGEGSRFRVLLPVLPELSGPPAEHPN